MISTVVTTVSGVFASDFALSVVVLLLVVLISPLYNFHMFYDGEWRRSNLFGMELLDIQVPANWKTRKEWFLWLVNVAIFVGGVTVSGASDDDAMDLQALLFVLLIWNAFLAVLHVYWKLFGMRRALRSGHAFTMASVLSGFAIALWIGAVACYTQKTYDISKTAAASRRLNSECELFHFYDFHDLWHLISSTASFCTFSALLCFDEALRKFTRCELAAEFATS